MTKKEHARGALLSASVIRGVVGPGLNSSLGIFFPAVAASLGVGIGTLSLSVSVGALAGMLYMTSAERLFERFGARVSTLAGIFPVCLSFAAMAIGSHVSWWYLAALPFGAGTVILVNLLGPLLAGEQKNSVGGVLGYMMTLSGMAAMILQPTLTTFVSRFGWRLAYAIGGGIAAVVLCICVRWIPRDACRKDRTYAEPITRSDRRITGVLFLFLAVIAACNAFHQHMTTCATAQGYSAAQVGTILFISMAGATLGGVLLGNFSDRIGAVAGGLLSLACGGASMCLYLFAAEQYVLFSLASALHGVASAAIGITAQAIAREWCGARYPKVLAMVLRAVPLATVVAMPLYGAIYDYTGTYRFAWWGMLVLLFLAAVALVAVFRRVRQVV